MWLTVKPYRRIVGSSTLTSAAVWVRFIRGATTELTGGALDQI